MPSRPVLLTIPVLAVSLLLAACGSGSGARATDATAADTTAAAAPCVSGMLTRVIPLPAGVHVPDSHVDVLLPSSYCRSRSVTYPVLYLLHGTGDTYQSWARRTDLVSYASAFPLIVVMPDGGHGATATWYADWVNGAYQEATYVTSVLPAYVAAHFRVRPHDAAVAGNSMGGFGAMSLAARHPGVYRAAASFSGAVDMLLDAPESGVLFAELNASDGTPGPQVWGNQTTDRAVWVADNPVNLAPRLAGVKLFIASGTGTKGGAEGDVTGDQGAYVEEAGIRLMNAAFVGALQAAHVPFTADLYQGGYHGWAYWQADLHHFLPALAAALGQ